MKQLFVILICLFCLFIVKGQDYYFEEVIHRDVKKDYETKRIVFESKEYEFENKKFLNSLDSLLSTYISDSLWQKLSETKYFYLDLWPGGKMLSDSMGYSIWTIPVKDPGQFAPYGGHFPLHGCTCFVENSAVSYLGLKYTGRRERFVDTLTYTCGGLWLVGLVDNYVCSIIYREGRLSFTNPENLLPWIH